MKERKLQGDWRDEMRKNGWRKEKEWEKKEKEIMKEFEKRKDNHDYMLKDKDKKKTRKKERKK